MRRVWVASAVLAASVWGSAAPAAVKLGFYSRDFGEYFPNAFVMVSGAMDQAPAAAVKANYGFTAKVISPAILFGPVSGEIIGMDKYYVEGSERHFSMTLTDDQYRRLMALVQTWRTLPGKSYDLHHRNCVSFVKAVAEMLGLATANTGAYGLKPRSFLDEVGFENPGKVNMADHYVPKLANTGHSTNPKSLSAAGAGNQARRTERAVH